MGDYQRLIEEIRRVFYAENDPDAEVLARIADRYAEAATEINTRLHRCDELLHKGLRNEALQQCENEPNLLDAVAVLDFPEREQWSDYVQQFGLPVPPELLIHVAADLNEAYSAEQPLSQLMRRHRLHALARSSLRQRIGIMRQVARLDAENPIWEDDLRTFERARHGELPAAVAAAVKHGDVNSLSQLEQEVTDPHWLQPPSKSLVDHTVEAHTRLRAKQARAQLTELEPELTQAFSQFDAERGRRIRDQWNARAAIADLPPDHALAEMVAPAMDWLAEEDRKASEESGFQQVLADLDRALEHAADRAELERLSHVAFRFERELPSVLARRLADRLDYLDMLEVRRHRLTLAGVVLSVLLLGSLTGWGIVHYLQSQELAGNVAYVESLLNDGKLDVAEARLTELKQSAPDLYNTPEMQRLEGQWAVAVRSEAGRKEQFAALVQSAEATGGNDPTFETVAAGFAVLQRADELARTDVERRQVARLRLRIEQSRTELQQQVDERFAAALDEFRQHMQQLDAHDLEAIKQLIDEGGQLEQQPHVTAELRSQLGPLLARLRGMRDTEVQERHVASLLLTITASVGSRQQFQAKLTTFTEEFPTSKRAADFQRVLKNEPPLWKQLEQWRAALDGASTKVLTSLKPDEAAMLANELQQLARQSPGFPAAEEVQELVAYLQSVARRVDANGNKLHFPLIETLNNPTVAGLFVLQDRAGRRYYCDRRPAFSGGTAVVRYFNGFDLMTKGIRSFSIADVANPRSGESYVWDASQSVFSREALDRLAALKDDNWEPTFTELIVRLQSDDHMDACLKLQLLGRVLEVGCQGSLCLERAFAKHVEQLAGALIDPTVNWLDPDDAAGRKARAVAEDVLRRLPDADAAAKRVAELTKRFSRPGLGPRFDWFGWLHRDRLRQWSCSPPKRPAEHETAELFVLYSADENEAARMVRIGRLSDGQIALEAPPESALVEGRPVFAVQQQRPSHAP